MAACRRAIGVLWTKRRALLFGVAATLFLLNLIRLPAFRPPSGYFIFINAIIVEIDGEASLLWPREGEATKHPRIGQVWFWDTVSRQGASPFALVESRYRAFRVTLIDDGPASPGSNVTSTVLGKDDPRLADLRAALREKLLRHTHPTSNRHAAVLRPDQTRTTGPYVLGIVLNIVIWIGLVLLTGPPLERQYEKERARRKARRIARHLAKHECPQCRYDIRGLTQPRCPECGFTWSRNN